MAERDRRAAEAAFEGLGFEHQLQTALVLTGDDLQEWLLLSADCTDLVRALPPEHLHQAVKLIGAEDALALLAAASSAQMQALMDIEWFTDNRLDHKKVRHWVELLMELNEDEADQALQGLDPNALAEFLRKRVKPNVSQEYLLLALHLNQRYLFTPDDLDTNDDLIEHFLNFLYAVDRDLFGEILELMISGDPKSVAADVEVGREERLISRGFPALHKAERMLAPLDTRAYGVRWPEAGAGAESASAALQTVRAAAPFLATALAWGRARGMLGERTERAFIAETADIANALLLAYSKDASEPGIKQEALMAVQVLASVGLEACAGGSPIAAAERLKALDNYELFRIGWSLVREVAGRAWELAGEPRIEAAKLGRNLAWLPKPLRDAVREAEDLMSWREAARRSGMGPVPKETPASEDAAEPGARSTTPRELLTWPGLCAYKLAVDRAFVELERRVEQAQQA